MPTAPVVVATWPFGKLAADAALPLLAAGKPPLDAVLAGARVVEDDLSVMSVGFGSVADRVGRLTLDSCVMDGKTLECGGVAALEHVRSASAVARRVMDRTPHVLLVGEGAKWFALEQGFKLEMPHTPESVKAWYDRRPKKDKPAPKVSGPDDINVPLAASEFDHDTVTVLGLGQSGSLAGVCTTSGLAYKLPGRVGDSPLIGSGLYVDDEAGAAGATGVGEEVIRIVGSFTVVELMRQGQSPQQACESACKRVTAASARRGAHPAQVAFLALSPKGEVGAASTAGTNFSYAVGRDGNVEVVKAREVA